VLVLLVVVVVVVIVVDCIGGDIGGVGGAVCTYVTSIVDGCVRCWYGIVVGDLGVHVRVDVVVV